MPHVTGLCHRDAGMAGLFAGLAEALESRSHPRRQSQCLRDDLLLCDQEKVDGLALMLMGAD